MVNFPKALEEIEKGAFEDCRIDMVRIPDGVKKIPDWTFHWSSTMYLEMNNVEEIGEGAFADMEGLVRIFFPRSVSKIKRIGKDAFMNTYFHNDTQDLDLSQVEFIDERAFCGAFVNLIFSDSYGNSVIEEIPRALNRDNKCQSLLTLGSSIRKIGGWAFFGNSNLSFLKFHTKKIDEIGTSAFQHTSIRTLYLPEETGMLGKNAFADIPTLREIYCPCAVPPVNKNAFGGLTRNDIPVYIPVGTLEAYSKAPGWDYFTNFVELAEFPGQSGIEDAVADGADAVRVYAEGGRLRITGVEPGTRYTVYTVDGAMISSGIAEAPAALPAGAVYVVKVDGKGYKVKI